MSYIDLVYQLDPDRLEQEPERLEKERTSVLTNIRELAFSNYGTFIRTIRCCEEIKEYYTGLHDDTEKFMKELRSVEDEGSHFLKTFQMANVERNNLIAAKHSSEDVKKLFELSSLIERCIRKGHYEEAFELIQLASRLGRCLGKIAIVLEVTERVKSQRNYLPTICLQQLRAPLTLTQCLKLVGFLRRMDVYSEAELQFQFLLCRDSWLQSQLDKQSFLDEYQRLTHIVEVYQDAMFDVILQYRAVFSEESLHSSSGCQQDVPKFHCPSVVASWLHYRLQCFMETLSSCLLHCPVDRLDSIMMHCMYFGASMGRVGTDVRHLLVSIFEDHILKLMRQSLAIITTKLLDSLKSTDAFRIVEMSSAASDADSYLDVKSGSSIRAPITLLSYPSLAIYCNRIIEIFDKLHSCIPMSLALFTAELLDSCLSLMVDSLKTSFERSADPNGVITFGTLVEESLVPFLDKCLEELFPASNLSTSLGISLAALIQKGLRPRLKTTKLREWLQDAQNRKSDCLKKTSAISHPVNSALSP